MWYDKYRNLTDEEWFWLNEDKIPEELRARVNSIIEHKSEEFIELQSRNSQLEDQVNELDDDLHDAQTEEERLNARIEELQEKVEYLETDNRELEESLQLEKDKYVDFNARLNV